MWIYKRCFETFCGENAVIYNLIRLIVWSSKRRIFLSWAITQNCCWFSFNAWKLFFYFAVEKSPKISHAKNLKKLEKFIAIYYWSKACRDCVGARISTINSSKWHQRLRRLSKAIKRNTFINFCSCCCRIDSVYGHSEQKFVQLKACSA